MNVRRFPVLLCAVAVASVAARSATSGQDPRLAPPASRLETPASRLEIDAVFAPWDKNDSPGCALGVFRDGAVAYQRGYGMASLEHDVAITPEAVFYAGSVSKQFTAMAAALAMQQGKLAYNDPIRTYLPELPAYADAITVSHLLHHTSGLRDYNTLLTIAGRRDEDAWDNRVVLQMTARQTALNFTPGDEYLYSNTGYTLLATIVERATGTPFAAFADANIFKPLGMSATHYHVDATRLVRHRALGYGGRPGQWTLDTPINERAGAGGLYTSVPDLQKWDENFYTGKVGGAEVLKRIQTQGTLNDGKPLAYAWGLQIGDYRGLPIVEHGGSLGGYRAHIMRFPSQHTSVVLLCNASAIVPTTLARRVADVVLGDRFIAPVPPAGPRGVAGSILYRNAQTAAVNRAYVGRYYSDEVQALFRISVDEGGALLKDALLLTRETDSAPILLLPEGPPDEFHGSGLAVRFQRDASKKVTALTVDAGRVRDIRFTKR
jgi:CubicO group peptidase (beta-lactamase class C family)